MATGGVESRLIDVADLVERLTQGLRHRAPELLGRPDRPPLTGEALAAVDDDGEEVGAAPCTSAHLAGATIPDLGDQLLRAEPPAARRAESVDSAIVVNRVSA